MNNGLFLVPNKVGDLLLKHFCEYFGRFTVFGSFKKKG